VEIELTSAGQTLTCLSRDEGAFRIEAHDLSPVAADPEARLTLRRVRLSPFDAEGSHSHGYKAIGRNFPGRSVGWYRKAFDIPESDERWRLDEDSLTLSFSPRRLPRPVASHSRSSQSRVCLSRRRRRRRR